MMRKTILITILGLLSSFLGLTQLSDLHYFPPLKQRSNGLGVNQQLIYLSTPETNAFDVNIFRGTSTIAIATITISNALPATYALSNGDNNITLVNDSNTGIILSNSGLRFVSSNGERFYVNFRGRNNAQATSLTSKGREGMGHSFKWGGVPNTGTTVDLSNTLGIMATEDNTTITITDYDTDCVFRFQSDIDGITTNTITLTLNANQSYVLEALVINNNATFLANRTGFIGASIEADKPIVVNSGAMNTSSNSNEARDAGIDQAVPISKLGQEYVFIRARGTNILEYVIIIGTEDNTEIFVNGSTTPIATIDEGEYYKILGTNYSGTSAGSNMYVTTTKNAYAYQNIGGSSADNTGGLNFVTPVHCEMPDSMNHIPDIKDVVGIDFKGGITIIASTSTPNANILVTDDNGTVTLPAPNTLSGTIDWKTFYIPNLKGDVSVQSSGPIAVSFFGANSSAGITGYFSGFDLERAVTLIVDGMPCIPSNPIEIEQNIIFDSYKWFKDEVEIVGATSSSLIPTEDGNYMVETVKGSCTYQSNIFSIKKCSVITNRRITYDIDN